MVWPQGEARILQLFRGRAGAYTLRLTRVAP